MSSLLSTRWLALIVLVLLLAGGILVVVNLPTTPRVAVGTFSTPTLTPSPVEVTLSSNATATPKPRAFAGPPVTKTNTMILTPDYATSVPLPLTKNFDVKQITLGRSTYTMWCASCHGDRGQGLDVWRYSWDPDHQNCSKSGCHGVNHPPDGFAMLKAAPALIGPSTLRAFQNAQQLFMFIRAAMPYQSPGVFSDEEYWAVTAYLADQHSANADRKVLSDSTGADVTLH